MINYKISVDDEEFAFSEEQTSQLDLLELEAGKFHVLQNNKAYRANVLYSNFMDKTLTIEVNGNSYQVAIADSYDQMVEEMGLSVNTSQKVNEIKAPMPGLILDILVEVGQEITEGTPLLVLSAMKMENIILSQGDGVLKSIEVAKDDAVEKGQLIIEME
ncbi:biotin/lipoyl-containing protein [Croceitalea marina]|uniref:Biotin/lipoyl-containing protein n=1 Tax=Croceitalea marina TaxID=1775166 RepID=A0ABW5N0W9_9FLAO